MFSDPDRQPTKDVNRQVIARNAAPERLWAHSREPIRQPLLMKLLGNTDFSHKACLAFTDILHTPEFDQKVAFLPMFCTSAPFYTQVKAVSLLSKAKITSLAMLTNGILEQPPSFPAHIHSTQPTADN